MRKTILITLTLAATFSLGFTFNNLISNKSDNTSKMKKVTGIGGIFLKCKDPNKMKEWYKTHLGLDAGSYGAIFEWREGSDSKKRVLHLGIYLLKQQNILNLLQKIL